MEDAFFLPPFVSGDPVSYPSAPQKKETKIFFFQGIRLGFMRKRARTLYKEVIENSGV